MLGTLRDNFVGTVSRWPDRKAILYGDRAYTFGELNASVNQLAPPGAAHGTEIVPASPPLDCPLFRCPVPASLTHAASASPARAIRIQGWIFMGVIQ